MCGACQPAYQPAFLSWTQRRRRSNVFVMPLWSRPRGIHYDGRDTFMMGEHWVKRQILHSGQCELTRPSHLQSLVIDGKQTLIGVGYVCGLGHARDSGTAAVWD